MLHADSIGSNTAREHSGGSTSAARAKLTPLASPFEGSPDPEGKLGEEWPGVLGQEGAESGAGALGQVFQQCWPVLGAIFFSGTFFVLAFPFFPYVPSDGTFGQELPRVGLPSLMASHYSPLPLATLTSVHSLTAT